MKMEKRLRQGEFIALMAMTAATVAFSIDAMLPALPQIGQALSPHDLNKAQLIVTSFVFGMGLGTFFTGPLSDAFGRKPVMIGGALIYMAAALTAWIAPSLELMLAARVLQGLGAAGPRVVAMAVVRDLYAGRDMARITSFIMVVFALVPALAPTLGYYVVQDFGWRAIFLAFVLFSLVSVLWLGLRQPETLKKADRLPLHITPMFRALKEVLSIRTTRLCILIQTLAFGMLFSVLSSTQQVFDLTFGQGHVFHLWFGCIAVVAASASVINARLVGRLGMTVILKSMFRIQIAVSSLMVMLTLLDGPYWLSFGVYILWTTTVFFQAGLSIGNLNALAMEPLGHVAGMAASVIASISTVGAVLIAAPIALAFNGTPLPMAVGVLLCATLALWLTNQIRKPGVR
jgi:DHA1 family bicyclomycin/chloramphenicol resistance-like MFS transporter